MLHDDVVAQVRTLLIEGAIPPGERISERDLCARLNVSRTPLREALKVLAAEGQIILLPNRGARAARLTPDDLAQLFEVYAALEALAGELAAERITAAELDRVGELHREMTSAYAELDLAGYYRCNRAIHEAIIAAAHNQALSQVYEQISARVRRVRFLAPMPPERWLDMMREHDAILNALQRRDGAVLSLILRRHLREKQAEVIQAGFAETVQAIALGETGAVIPPAPEAAVTAAN